MKKNSLPSDVRFEVVNTAPSNRYAISANIIEINSEDLDLAVNDNEVAYVISKELGEVIVKNISPKAKPADTKYIDAMGMDLMINSGYNPLAGIAMQNKLNHKDTAEYLYDFLTYNYPSKVLAGYNEDCYEEFLKSIQPQINEIKSNKKKLKKFFKTQAKLSSKRFKYLSQFNEKTSKLVNWNMTTDLLKSITEPEEQ